MARGSFTSGSVPGEGAAFLEERQECHMATPEIIRRPGEIAQAYGPEVHILDDLVALTWLAQLCAPKTRQPQFGNLIGMLYNQLVPRAIAAEYPRCTVSRETRMTTTSGVLWTGDVVDPSVRTVVVDIARGGTHPSFLTSELLAWTVGPDAFRRDLIVLSRKRGADGKVDGADVLGDKCDGSIEGMIALVPDAMGATGGSMATAFHGYEGRPTRVITLSLIVTPEFVRTMQEVSVELDVPFSVWAFRLDRGMSHPEALAAIPGVFPSPVHPESGTPFESGLDERQFIVAGGGDFGREMYLTSM